MSKANAWETGLTLLVFNNTNYADVGDATGLRGSSTAGSLYVALHTGDPGETGTQATSEANYTGYARVAVARSAAGWTCATDTASNTAATTFGACTAGSSTCTHVSIGVASAGSTAILYSGALTSSLAITSGITPSFAIGALTVTEA